jgi:PAS domain S-box-containing protein
MTECPVESSAEILIGLSEKKRISVLHVDDEPDLSKITRQCLEMEGPFQVDTASSVEEAWERIEKKSYDAVVCDYQMPGKDGLELLKELRQKGNETPFIVFTGKGREEVAIKALNLGADQYLNKSGNPETVYKELAHAVRQATERKTALKKIRESEEKYRDLFELAPDILITLNMKGMITSCNAAALAISGYSKEEIVGKHFSKLGFLRIGDVPKYLALFASIARGQIPEPVQAKWHHKDGTPSFSEFHVGLVKEDGKAVGIIVIARDITESKKAEAELLEQKERAEKYLSIIGNIVVALDSNGRVTLLNKRGHELLGYKEGELVGKEWFETCLPQEDREEVRRVFQACMQGQLELAESHENAVLAKNGEKRIVLWHNTVLRDDYGKIVGTLSSGDDITERKKAEFELQESEKRFRELTNQLPVIVYEIDRKGRLTFVNDKGFELTGYSHEDVERGLNILQLVAREDQDKAKARIQATLSGERIGYNEYTLVKKDGNTLAVMVRGSPIAHEGKIVGLRGIVIDITEKKKMVQDLRDSEEIFHAISTFANDAVILADGEGKVSYWNPAAKRLFGYSEEEALGKEYYGLVVPQRLCGHVQSIFERATKMGIGTAAEGKVETIAMRKNGAELPVELSISELQVKGKWYALCLVRDSSERKKAEEVLRESEQKYRSLVELAPDGILAVDLNGIVTSVNDSFLRLVGYDSEKVVGRHFTEIESVRAQDIPRFLEMFNSVMRRKSVSPIEFSYIRRDGTSRWAEVHPGLLMKDGKVVGLQVIMRDITERKNAEVMIEESRQKFAGLFSGNPEATVYVDPGMHILDVNPRFESLFGYSLNDVRGKQLNDVVVPENLLEEGRMLDEKAAEGCVYHDTLRKRKDGSLIPVSVSAAPIHVHDKLMGYVWLYKDISQQKTVEESLKESDERFKALFAGGPEASVYLSPDFHIQDVNRRFEQLFGYSLAEIRGKQLDDVVVQKDKKEEASMLNEKAVGGYVYHDTVRRRKDGSLVPVSISAAPIVIKGQLSGLVGTYKDISDLKSAEEKLAVMNEKLRVVGGLTRHDIRNKLSIVTGNAYLMKRKLKDHPEATEDVEELESACAAIVQLLEFARDYERLGLEELTYVDLKDSIEKAVSLFTNTDQTKIVNECHGLTVLADSLLSKLFYNLIDNSLKHGSHVTRIGISCEESKDELRLVYEDNGVGITQEAKAKLFSEGYTTGKGSGHGLYLIRKMMEAYGWSIREKGLPGVGARFVIAIPKLNKQGKENYRIRQPEGSSAKQIRSE